MLHRVGEDRLTDGPGADDEAEHAVRQKARPSGLYRPVKYRPFDEGARRQNFVVRQIVAQGLGDALDVSGICSFMAM